MQFNYTDEHLIPKNICNMHELPQEITDWILSDAQPQRFHFREDIVPNKKGNKHTEGMEVLQRTMYGDPDVGNPSPNSGLHYLELDLPWEVPYGDMHKEADSFREHYVPHRSAYEGHGGWKSLCIHGLSAVQTQYHDRYGFKNDDGSPMEDKDVPYIWTDICKWMPTIANFFKTIFNYQVYARVRIMQLEPGGYIFPHKDWDMHTLGPVNLALNNPDNCRFYMKGRGVVPFKPGQANKLDIGFEHIVFNDSDEYRYHMIIHGWPGNSMEPWNSIFYNSYKNLLAKNMEKNNALYSNPN
jgi:hypothetical protein